MALKRSLGLLLIFIGIIIALGTIFQPFLHLSRTSTVSEKAIDISDYDKLSFHTSVADLQIQQYPGEELKLKVKGNSSNYNIDTTSTGGSTLEIAIKSNKRWLFISERKSSVTVLLPESYHKELEIENTVGDLRFLSPLNIEQLNVKMTAGDVKRLSGTINYITFNSTAGDFRAYDLVTKETDLTGTAGDFRLESFSGDLKGGNSAGNLTVDYAKENGNINWHTSAGEVRLNIPDPSFELDASTTLGDISINVPITLEQSGKHYRGVVNNSDKKVQVSTSVGDIRIN